MPTQGYLHKHLIPSAAKNNPDMERVLRGIHSQLEAHAAAIGVPLAMNSTSATGVKSISPPMVPQWTVVGIDGKFVIDINAPQDTVAQSPVHKMRLRKPRRAGITLSRGRFNADVEDISSDGDIDFGPKDLNDHKSQIEYQLQSSQNLLFDAVGLVNTYGPESKVHWEIIDPGQNKYWRLRTRYTNSDWSAWNLYVDAVFCGVVQIYSGLLSHQDAIVHSGLCAGGGGNKFSYRLISSLAYTFVAGDQLHYDLYIDPSNPAASVPGQQGALDFLYNGGATAFRSTATIDQNGLSCHPATDTSQYAFGRWYHRVFRLDALAGQTTTSWQSALEQDVAGTFKIRLANIRIVNGNTTVAVIYSSGPLIQRPVASFGESGYSNVLVYTAEFGNSSFNGTAVNIASSSATPGILSSVTAAGVSTITVAANTIKFGGGTLSYNGGTVTGLAASTLYFIYADDPNYTAGAVTYIATTDASVTVNAEGRIYFGSITTGANAVVGTYHADTGRDGWRGRTIA